MYTLRRGEDGRLHGPCNKKVYSTFSSRKTALEWAREQATRRGFGPKTDKTVQILVDGEKCLEQNLRALFPRAILTLDIRHAQERLWLAQVQHFVSKKRRFFAVSRWFPRRGFADTPVV